MWSRAEGPVDAGGEGVARCLRCTFTIAVPAMPTSWRLDESGGCNGLH